MLVLSRKLKQQLLITVDGKLVTVTVNDVSGKQVRLGIEAPREVRVWRAELKERAA